MQYCLDDAIKSVTVLVLVLAGVGYLLNSEFRTSHDFCHQAQNITFIHTSNQQIKSVCKFVKNKNTHTAKPFLNGTCSECALEITSPNVGDRKPHDAVGCHQLVLVEVDDEQKFVVHHNHALSRDCFQRLGQNARITVHSVLTKTKRWQIGDLLSDTVTLTATSPSLYVTFIIQVTLKGFIPIISKECKLSMAFVEQNK